MLMDEEASTHILSLCPYSIFKERCVYHSIFVRD